MGMSWETLQQSPNALLFGIFPSGDFRVGHAIYLQLINRLCRRKQIRDPLIFAT